MINYANEVSKYSLFHLTESISNLRIFSLEKKAQPEVDLNCHTSFFQGCLIKDGIIELTSRAKPVFLKTTLLTQLG